MALGVLPHELLANSWKDVIMQLSTACAIEVSLPMTFVAGMFVDVLVLAN